MILLDLFCGAGGAGEGYRRAGFDIVGVDSKKQPRYPGIFLKADALVDFHWILAEIQPVAIHASPPCQAYSKTRNATGATHHPELIPPTRTLLRNSGLPWVIENVPGAPLDSPVVLCGTGFGLPVVATRDGERRRLYRHRLFECSFSVMAPPCAHTHPALGVYGQGPWDRKGDLRKGGYQGTKDERAQAMGIDWMTRDELSQAIPPIYTEHIGEALMANLCSTAEVAQ